MDNRIVFSLLCCIIKMIKSLLGKFMAPHTGDVGQEGDSERPEHGSEVSNSELAAQLRALAKQTQAERIANMRDMALKREAQEEREGKELAETHKEAIAALKDLLTSKDWMDAVNLSAHKRELGLKGGMSVLEAASRSYSETGEQYTDRRALVLTPEQAEKIDAFLQLPDGKRELAVKHTFGEDSPEEDSPLNVVYAFLVSGETNDTFSNLGEGGSIESLRDKEGLAGPNRYLNLDVRQFGADSGEATE